MRASPLQLQIGRVCCGRRSHTQEKDDRSSLGRERASVANDCCAHECKGCALSQRRTAARGRARLLHKKKEAGVEAEVATGYGQRHAHVTHTHTHTRTHPTHYEHTHTTHHIHYEHTHTHTHTSYPSRTHHTHESEQMQSGTASVVSSAATFRPYSPGGAPVSQTGSSKREKERERMKRGGGGGATTIGGRGFVVTNRRACKPSPSKRRRERERERL